MTEQPTTKIFSITTTLPYINAKPHIGFAFEILGADILARYHRLLGEQVIFNTGTDEHGQKIYEKALELGMTPQAYCDSLVGDFQALREKLNLSYDRFIRTTDEHHVAAAQEMWRRCFAAGDIYKQKYEVKYCVGCELEKTDSELVHGRCPLHPDKELEVRAEENYFFRFSKYETALLELYKVRKMAEEPFVQPEGKQKEIEAFVEGGLKDFSISRVAAKMPWGIPVPDDEEQVMYVWFDALTNYISTLGWPEVDLTRPESGWPVIQVAGKDNLRQQSAMWQAMLMSAGIEPSAKILINGFIMVNGQKMSKSLGNVISPDQMIEKYGTEVTRYLLANLGNFGEDTDVTWEKMAEVYNAELTNGLGNLCSRVAKMMSQTADFDLGNEREIERKTELTPEFKEYLNNYQIREGLDWIKEKVAATDKYLSVEQPWKLTDEPAKKRDVLQKAGRMILEIADHLQIFMPEISRQISEHFRAETIQPMTPLFPRITNS